MKHKIAQINLYFWILKIIATTLGETAGDMFSMTLNLGYIYSFLMTGGVLLTLLFWQIRLAQFNPFVFWSTIIGTTTVGTEISDMMDRSFHLGYFWGSILLILFLCIVLFIWYKKEKNLYIDCVEKRSTEILFWIAVLFSNSLGTAFGDFLTDDFALSYMFGALITASIIAVVLLLHYVTRINGSILFWVAFIFTRPFGATFGDFLTKSYAEGGIALDRVESTVVLLLTFMIILVMSHTFPKKSIYRKEGEL